MENVSLSAWVTAWNPTDPSDVCPKKGDILDCGNGEYKVYHHGKWKPIAYEKVVDPSKPVWEEYISKPFRNVEE